MENKQDKGFTLVELLIVIVILGILATVTVFAVRGITTRGQDNACDVDQRTLSTSIEAFYAQYQQDPTELTDLTVGIDGDNDGVNDGPVLKDEPSNFSFAGASGKPNPAGGDWGDVTVGGEVINADSAAFYAPSTSPCA